MPMGEPTYGGAGPHLARTDVGLLASPILLEHGRKSTGIWAANAETVHFALYPETLESYWLRLQPDR